MREFETKDTIDNGRNLVLELIEENNRNMQFEWDDEKNHINKKKHGISFETASKVFNDPRYIEIYDAEHSIVEDRYIAIGLVEDVLFVVFTERKDAVRLISARLATEVERRYYYDSEL